MIRGFAFLLFSATALVAEDPFLALPLDCEIGVSCVIEDYPDVRSGPESGDYACGLKTRDQHSGTDFALSGFAEMTNGVSVLAAADGTVEAIRNSEPDRSYLPEHADQMQGRECGNAVRINHGNGYQTVYCHMRQGSVSVFPGQSVRKGDILGLVGLSGKTNYPHLHLTVLERGQVIDPFAPRSDNECDTTPSGLWSDPVPYTPTGLFTAGISNRVPDLDAVTSGDARLGSLQTNEAMVLYGHAFHTQRGDRLTLNMDGPRGEVFAHQTTLDVEQAQLFRAFGRRPPEQGWPAGAYRGYVRLYRGEELIAVRHADVIVE